MITTNDIPKVRDIAYIACLECGRSIWAVPVDPIDGTFEAPPARLGMHIIRTSDVTGPVHHGCTCSGARICDPQQHP